MGTIIKKIKKGNPYYYAVESKRVDGKPRIVWQKYLGTLDDIVNKCSSSKRETDEPFEVDIFEAGGVAAMLHIANKLRIVEIIDEHVPKRNQGASVGQYILLAAINRVLGPCSKLQMPEWYKKSILNRLWKYPSDTFDSQSFWNNMDLIPEESLDVMQEKIVLKLKTEFGIDSTMLLYDTTNFFTYVATGNKRNTIAQRGRNKAKRDDLRQVGLALLVSKDFQIPLFHKIYEGNIPDRGLFTQTSKELVDWQNSIGLKRDTTLVFDKGNISEDAMTNLIVLDQKFVCAVPKTTDNELFTTEIDKFTAIPGLAGTKAISIFVEIWHKKIKAVLCYSESFFSSELVELTESIRKSEKQLNTLAKWLEKGPSRPGDSRYYTKSSVENKINEILSKSYLKKIIKVKIDVQKSKKNETSLIQYTVDQIELNKIISTSLGRTLLYTSQIEWSENEIITAYRSQQQIEEVFKHMKNKDYLRWQPSFHWTDHKIKVHSFYTVMALLLATLAHKTAVQNGIDLTLLQMLDELNDIREVALIYSGKVANKQNGIALSRMSAKQKHLAEVLEIPSILRMQK